MTLANLMALVQEDVKRMLAYSSISHAGFVMVAIALATEKANTGIFLYYGLFMFTNLGAFAMLWVTRHKHRVHHARYDHPYEKFSGMVKIMPMGAVVMGLFMLSLAGVPPFSVFWGKVYLMSATIDAGYIWLAIIMGLNSAIAAYYYLKLIVYMFLKEPTSQVTEETTYYNVSKPLLIILGLAVFVTVGSIFYVDPLIEYITEMMRATNFGI
jgi:NADH-quinone oxidoreductase subunit N